MKKKDKIASKIHTIECDIMNLDIEKRNLKKDMEECILDEIFKSTGLRKGFSIDGISPTTLRPCKMRFMGLVNVGNAYQYKAFCMPFKKNGELYLENNGGNNGHKGFSVSLDHIKEWSNK